MKKKTSRNCEITPSLQVINAIVAIFNVANMYLNAVYQV